MSIMSRCVLKNSEIKEEANAIDRSQEFRIVAKTMATISSVSWFMKIVSNYDGYAIGQRVSPMSDDQASSGTNPVGLVVLARKMDKEDRK